MWARLRRFSALPARGKYFFFRAWLLLPRVSRSLRKNGFRATQAALEEKSPLPRESKAPEPRIDAAILTARVTAAAARCQFSPTNCLTESLATWYLLRRQNIAAELRIGVQKSGEQLAAHAWVEYAGTALRGGAPGHRHYAAFDAAFPTEMK